MDKEDLKLLLTYADCNMNISELASRLHYHRTTITKKLIDIGNREGCNLLTFWGLHKLLVKLEDGYELH